jgi:hypothetical protein
MPRPLAFPAASDAARGHSLVAALSALASQALRSGQTAVQARGCCRILAGTKCDAHLGGARAAPGIP